MKKVLVIYGLKMLHCVFQEDLPCQMHITLSLLLCENEMMMSDHNRWQGEDSPHGVGDARLQGGTSNR